MRMAAIYARVSSEQQREAHTIGSQTAALIEWAKSLDLEVPTAWIFEDNGYSGATLERPGLERVRDLAAEGQIQAVLVYAPDRLSRKYAYQILLIEELARQGVETRFLNAPQSATAEDQLLVQFQGMIAEYERAQILERSRRGKRHRARAGEISVLSGAPYGYRYIRKSDEAPAAYAVIEAEARVVRHVYARYTVAGLSIGALTRELNDQAVATRKPNARWERSMVWAMLRNPAYRGTACFGKTRAAPRQRVTRALRMRGGMTTRNSANHERPREEWIEIPVPALIAEEMFARAQELLHENKVRARRRTIEPSVVQGLVSCRKCGYALSRTSTRSSARAIHYYRCLGSDVWRHLGGPVCKNRPVRQDLLDQIVWTEVMRLLEEPALIEQELDRRLVAARAADPTKHREQTMQRELVRVGKGIERLLTAYQEELVSLEQLRERMPPLRQREQTLRTELHALAEQTRDRATYLRLAETLSAFLARLRQAADTLDILDRQRIVRLVVKEVLVGDDTIVIRHSIPVPSGPPGGSSPPALGGSDDLGSDRSYLLRTGRDHRPLWRPTLRRPAPQPVQHVLRQETLEQGQHSSIGHFDLHPREQGAAWNAVKVALEVRVHHVRVPRIEQGLHAAQRVFAPAARTESVALRCKVALENRFERVAQRRLDGAIPDGRNAQRSRCRTAVLLDVRPSDCLGAVGPVLQFARQPFQVRLQVLRKQRDRHMVDACGSVVGLHILEGPSQGPQRVDLIHQTEPHASLHALFERRQHAGRPDTRFGPGPAGTHLSSLRSLHRHCRRGRVRRSVRHASTFLRSFAPPALPGFLAPMSALTPAHRLGSSARVRMNTGLTTGRSPCFTYAALLTVPSPTTEVVSVVGFARYPLPRQMPVAGSGFVFH
jgi:site-specific DNA recombinase